jgi:4-hydroxy-3-methylbut-2-enyl diphosphate reductase
VNVRIDPTAGFCWGVVRTIDIAEEELRKGNPLVSLGDIIHNPKETSRLDSLGMTTIDHARMESLPDGTRVLIRAHGEPASTYRRAQELGIRLIDATCPIVTKLQERIRKYYLEGWQVVIYGKKDHAEVIGLRGVCDDDCIVITTLDEARDAVDLSRRTVLFSQTTMDKAAFHGIREFLRARVAEFHEGSLEEIATGFHAKDTICGQVSGRDKKLRAFAAENDVMIFVAGRKSSNGKVLYHICLEANPRTHFIEDAEEIDPSWFEGAENVGISGATSTPHWLMNEMKSHIEQLVPPAGDGLAAATLNQQHVPTNP